MLDVDGVLVNGRPCDGQSWFVDLEKDLGIPIDLLQRLFFVCCWMDIITGKKLLLPELSAFLHENAPDIPAQVLIDYWFSNDSALDKSILNSVSTLRGTGIKVFLATNQEHMSANYLMKNMGLESFFDGIFYSAALGYQKPMPEFFCKATEAVGGQPSEIILVDDTEENIVAARAFGWKAVQWRPGMNLIAELETIN